jgi:hypothetical protein
MVILKKLVKTLMIFYCFKKYGVPIQSQNLLSFKTGIPKLPSWMLAPEFNKF